MYNITSQSKHVLGGFDSERVFDKVGLGVVEIVEILEWLTELVGVLVSGVTGELVILGGRVLFGGGVAVLVVVGVGVNGGMLTEGD